MSERLTNSLTQDAKRVAPLSGRNGIINGAFDIWQRGTSIAYGANITVYHADRWASIRVASPSGATVERRTSSLTGFQYCARVQRDSGNTGTAAMYFGTGLESADSYRFAGKTVTLSYYARAGANYSPTSSALSAFITTGTGTDQNFITGFTGSTNVGTGVATLTTSWQRFTVTGTVASNVTQISANYSMTPVGTAGAADYFEITGVQLEVGSFATPFEFENVSTTLAKCQRYYYVVPRTADTFSDILNGGTSDQTTYARYAVYRPVMRTESYTLFSSAANLFGNLNASGNYAGTTISFLNNMINLYSAGLSTGQSTVFRANNSATAYIALSTEL